MDKLSTYQEKKTQLFYVLHLYLIYLPRDPREFIDRITLITPKVAPGIREIQGKQFFRQG